MAVVPTWLLGQNVSAFVLTGATVGSDGTLTDATGTGINAMAGLWDEISLEYAPQTEEISAADSVRLNNVLIKKGTRFRCTQIMQKAKASGQAADNAINPLTHIAATYDYVKVVFTRASKTWTGYFLLVGYSESPRAGRSTCEITLEMVDTGAANPALS